MRTSKCRLLIVTVGFRQAGAERFLYELCTALDRDVFDIEILTQRHLRPEERYYASKLSDIGIPIHYDITQPHYFTRVLGRLGWTRSWRRLMHRLHGRLLRFRLRRFRDHDLIVFVLLETYKWLQYSLSSSDRFVIHLLAHRFQYAYDPFADCRSDRQYRMVLMDPAHQIAELRGTPCEPADVFPLALPLECRVRTNLYTHPGPKAPLKIGFFSRLAPDRSVLPLFDAIAHVRQSVDATLHVFGGGDKTPYLAYLESRGISDAVVFEGHCEDLAGAIRDRQLTMAWMSAMGPVLGYSSLEVGSFGMPMAFWNISPSVPDADVLKETNGALHVFRHPVDLADFTIALLKDPARLVSIGERLRAFVIERHDAGKHIKALEHYYLRTAGFAAADRDDAMVA